MTLATPPEVRDELAFDEQALGMSSSAFDALIEELIERETERVEEVLDARIGETSATETLARPSHVEGHLLPLPHRPVQSLESVEIDTDRVGGRSVDTDDVWVESTHLELKPEADRSSWPTKRRSITVEWTHGYPIDETPEPVRGAVVGLVRQALQEIEADGIESESVDGHSVTYELGEDVVARHLRRAREHDAPTFYSGAGVI